MRPANAEKVAIPANIITMPAARPARVTGVMSPYPTVVAVTSAHHAASNRLVTFGLCPDSAI